MNLTYTVELKDWNNTDNYPMVYTGPSMVAALSVFKQYHLSGSDVILFIEDEKGNTIDSLENYGELTSILACNELFQPENEEIIKENKELHQQKEIYHNEYKEQLNKNEQLKKDNTRLQNENKQIKQQSNNKDNNLFWYAYRLRGFSPFCQPKGHIKQDSTIGRHGIIAYDRQLTEYELEEYELIPYNNKQTQTA